jgi:DNA-binding GntR family transcriptional regulator
MAMRRAAVARDVSTQVEHDVAFHRLIDETAGNGTLLQAWNSLGIHDRTALTFFAGSRPGPEVVETHVEILEALRTGDPELAATRIREHFAMFAELLLQSRHAFDGT